MKRYLIFGYSGHEARGGIHDLVACVDTMAEARDVIALDAGSEFHQIFDNHTMHVVSSNDYLPERWSIDRTATTLPDGPESTV